MFDGGLKFKEMILINFMKKIKKVRGDMFVIEFG